MRHPRRPRLSRRSVSCGRASVSRVAISAVLARDDLTCGERLVAFSLASFADRDNRARPGTPAAAARAGLSRSRYLQAREQIVRGGLIVVEEEATGRGRASTLAMTFVAKGPWWDGEINAELFEAVLGYSDARGPARLLLAAMAALADEHGAVYDLTTEQLCAAAGLADRTYRRARKALLASGQLILESGAGGRGNTNVWKVPDPRQRPDAQARRAPRRVTSTPGSATRGHPGCSVAVRRIASRAGFDSGRKGRSGSDGWRWESSGPGRGFRRKGRPGSDGFGEEPSGRDRGFGPKRGSGSDSFRSARSGNRGTKGGRNPGRNPGAYRARGEGTQEPQNPGRPPQPPWRGEPADSIVIEESYVTERGRERRRRVRVDLGEVRQGLGLPNPRRLRELGTGPGAAARCRRREHVRHLAGAAGADRDRRR
jgi:hypothetical protein